MIINVCIRKLMSLASLPTRVLLLQLMLAYYFWTARTDATYLPGSACTLSYTISPDFVFNSCTYPENLQATSWPYCFGKCCQSEHFDQYLDPNMEAIRHCQQQNQKEKLSQMETTAIITSTVVVGIILLYCFCKVCCRKCRKSDNAKVHKSNVHQVEWSHQHQINTLPQHIVWSSKARKRRAKAIDQTCVICLDDQTTAQLFCRHRFHPTCIGQWLTKNSMCPYCRLEDIQGVKIHCQTCFWMYFICTKILVASHSKELPSKCETCDSDSVNSMVEILPQESREHLDQFVRPPEQTCQ